LRNAARARAELTAITHRDRCLLIVPLYNNTGIRRCALPVLAAGGSVACVGRFDARCFIEWLERLSPTFYMGSIATQVAVAELLERHRKPIRHSLRSCSRAARRFRRMLRRDSNVRSLRPILQGYGMTETGNIAQAPMLPHRAPPRSSGLPSNVDVAILSESGREVACGETGEICVRGPEVFDGYEETIPKPPARPLSTAGFGTGDIGYVDAGGFLYVSGRIKDVINRGGAKISPTDVEDALMRHPDVIEAAAFALAHRTLGEDVAAAVVLRDAVTVSEAALREHGACAAPTVQGADANRRRRRDPARLLWQDQARLSSRLSRKRRCHTRFVAPRNRDESDVAHAFAHVLGIDRIGAHENFFQLGGDSLRGARVVDHLRLEFGKAIPLDALFRHPTAAELAVAIRSGAT
jgi:acyl-CoA synthetase (AMP-forming)/AMP-acid ligase II/acyl carrier protein